MSTLATLHFISCPVSSLVTPNVHTCLFSSTYPPSVGGGDGSRITVGALEAWSTKLDPDSDPARLSTAML